MTGRRWVGLAVAVLGAVTWFTTSAMGILLADALVGQQAIVQQEDDPGALFWAGEGASIVLVIGGAALAILPDPRRRQPAAEAGAPSPGITDR